MSNQQLATHKLPKTEPININFKRKLFKYTRQDNLYISLRLGYMKFYKYET